MRGTLGEFNKKMSIFLPKKYVCRKKDWKDENWGKFEGYWKG
jgi:hypothetical protein